MTTPQPLPELPEGWDTCGPDHRDDPAVATVLGPDGRWSVRLDRRGWASVLVYLGCRDDECTPALRLNGRDHERILVAYRRHVGPHDLHSKRIAPTSRELNRALHWCRAALGVGS